METKNKESNVARTPENENVKPKRKKIKIFFLFINILSISFFSAYSLFLTYKLAKNSIFSKIINYLLIAYIAFFVLLIIIGIFDKKHMKTNLQNYKSATAFFRYGVQILSFILSITTTISAFVLTGKTDFSSLIYAFLSLLLTLVLILVEIIKIKIRKNSWLIKENFLEFKDPSHTKTKKD